MKRSVLRLLCLLCFLFLFVSCGDGVDVLPDAFAVPMPDVVRPVPESALQPTRTVTVGGKEFPADTEEFHIRYSDITDVSAYAAELQTLPLLSRCVFDDEVPYYVYISIYETLGNSVTYSGIVTYETARFDLTAEEQDLSGNDFREIQILKAMLERMPKLKKVTLTDCGLTDDQLESLQKELPPVEIVWKKR